MELGAFYMALNVKDLKASRKFYEQLGFTAFDGKEEENWLMLRNGAAMIGLFQDMLQSNTLTFHPPDVRSIQKSLKASGVPFVMEADETATGPGHAVILDPDGNAILLDQT